MRTTFNVVFNSLTRSLSVFWLVIAVNLSSCNKVNHSEQFNLKRPSSNLLRSALENPTNAAVASVQIGTQLWTNQNLTVSNYRNGDVIPKITDNKIWISTTTGAWCWYMNDSVNYSRFGKLYNWYAVNDPRGLAPIGWHVPSDGEWDILANYLGGSPIAGGAMKETGFLSWAPPNTGATNSSGFNGLPGGYRFNGGKFNFLGMDGYFWSSTQNNSSTAWYRNLYYTDPVLYRFSSAKGYGFSVRLIKD